MFLVKSFAVLAHTKNVSDCVWFKKDKYRVKTMLAYRIT